MAFLRGVTELILKISMMSKKICSPNGEHGERTGNTTGNAKNRIKSIYIYICSPFPVKIYIFLFLEHTLKKKSTYNFLYKC